MYVFNLRLMQETILTTMTRSDLKELFRETFQELFQETFQEVYKNYPTRQPAETTELLTAKQAADYLNMGLPTLYGYVKREQIPYTKRGRLRFRRGELDQWLIDNNTR